MGGDPTEQQTQSVEQEITLQDIDLRNSLANNHKTINKHSLTFEQSPKHLLKCFPFPRKTPLAESRYQIQAHQSLQLKEERDIARDIKRKNGRIRSILYQEKVKQNHPRSLSQKNRICVSLSMKGKSIQADQISPAKNTTVPLKDANNFPKEFHSTNMHSNVENQEMVGRVCRIQQPIFHIKHPLHKGKIHGGQLSRMIMHRVMQAHSQM